MMGTNSAAMEIAGENATAIEGIQTTNDTQDATIEDLMGQVADFSSLVKDGEGQIG